MIFMRLFNWLIDLHARNVLQYAEHLREMDRIKEGYDTRLWLLKHTPTQSKEGEK